MAIGAGVGERLDVADVLVGPDVHTHRVHARVAVEVGPARRRDEIRVPGADARRAGIETIPRAPGTEEDRVGGDVAIASGPLGLASIDRLIRARVPRDEVDRGVAPDVVIADHVTARVGPVQSTARSGAGNDVVRDRQPGIVVLKRCVDIAAQTVFGLLVAVVAHNRVVQERTGVDTDAAAIDGGVVVDEVVGDRSVAAGVDPATGLGGIVVDHVVRDGRRAGAVDPAPVGPLVSVGVIASPSDIHLPLFLEVGRDIVGNDVSRDGRRGPHAQNTTAVGVAVGIVGTDIGVDQRTDPAGDGEPRQDRPGRLAVLEAHDAALSLGVQNRIPNDSRIVRVRAGDDDVLAVEIDRLVVKTGRDDHSVAVVTGVDRVLDDGIVAGHVADRRTRGTAHQDHQHGSHHRQVSHNLTFPSLNTSHGSERADSRQAVTSTHSCRHSTPNPLPGQAHMPAQTASRRMSICVMKPSFGQTLNSSRTAARSLSPPL